MWPQERTQGFSKIWPSDLVFDPTWPIFQLLRNFIATNILTKFHDCQTGNVACRAYTRFLRIWSNDLVLTRHDIFSNSSYISSRKTFWASSMIIGLKMWPLERTQNFSEVWISDLVFDPTWPNFKLISDLIKTNIMNGPHDYRTENVASKAYTRVFLHLT